MNLLCRLGVHSYVSPADGPGSDADVRRCRRCGKHHTGLLGPDQTLWFGGRDGITVGELRMALRGVPDDVEVEVESSTLMGRWAGADAAYLTTKRIAVATDAPQTVPVFRIAGGEHEQGYGWAPGMGGVGGGDG